MLTDDPSIVCLVPRFPPLIYDCGGISRMCHREPQRICKFYIFWQCMPMKKFQWHYEGGYRNYLFWLLPIFATSTIKLLHEKIGTFSMGVNSNIFFSNWLVFQLWVFHRNLFWDRFFFQLTGVPALARSSWRWKPCTPSNYQMLESNGFVFKNCWKFL